MKSFKALGLVVAVVLTLVYGASASEFVRWALSDAEPRVTEVSSIQVSFEKPKEAAASQFVPRSVGNFVAVSEVRPYVLTLKPAGHCFDATTGAFARVAVSEEPRAQIEASLSESLRLSGEEKYGGNVFAIYADAPAIGNRVYLITKGPLTVQVSHFPNACQWKGEDYSGVLEAVLSSVAISNSSEKEDQ